MTRQYVGARYVVKFYKNSVDPLSTDWEENVNYEALTFVTYSYNSYISRKPVPATIGAPTENPDYWALTGEYNGQIAHLQEEINDINSSIDDIKLKVENVLYLHDYDRFSDLVADINTLDNSCVIIDEDKNVDTDVVINKPTHFLGDANGHTIDLTNDIEILTDDFRLENARIKVNGGSFIFGSRSLSNAIVRFNIVNNIFYADDTNLQKALVFVHAVHGNISGNSFYSGVLNNQLMCIYHLQDNSGDWFQNVSITNNNFRRVYSMLYVEGYSYSEQCAGIEFCDNNSIWTVKGIYLESSDHFIICNNIIDFCTEPMYMRSPNGLRLIDNYIFSDTQNKVNVDIYCTKTCEHIVIEDNYFWNNTSHSSSNITYAIKISAIDNHVDLIGCKITNNYFRNFRYCIFTEMNVDGLFISGNSFKTANHTVDCDNTNYSVSKSACYANSISADSSNIASGIPVANFMSVSGHSVSVPAGSTTASLGASRIGTNIRSAIVKMPHSNIGGYMSINSATGDGVIVFSAPLPSDTNVTVEIMTEITKWV